MSDRDDIMDGTKRSIWFKDFGLIYTCNAGWIDLGHLNPSNKRPEIGAANLWTQISLEGTAVLDYRCKISNPYIHPMKRFVETINRPDHCDTDPRYKFSDGSTGYKVYYRQDHAGIPFKPGREGTYIVKHGLTVEQKKRVALSIFMEVSRKFENLQALVELTKITNSGYSQEDLVSNLIGFYIAVGEVSREQAIRACHPVSADTAKVIWDNDGAVGKNKNKSWMPMYATKTDYISAFSCTNECASASRQFPKIFQRIQAAPKGEWHKNLRD